MSTLRRQESIYAQGLLKEYGGFMQSVIDEMNKEYDSPINADTAEKVGLEYAKRLASKNAMKVFIQKLNSKANERS